MQGGQQVPQVIPWQTNAFNPVVGGQALMGPALVGGQALMGPALVGGQAFMGNTVVGGQALMGNSGLMAIPLTTQRSRQPQFLMVQTGGGMGMGGYPGYPSMGPSANMDPYHGVSTQQTDDQTTADSLRILNRAFDSVKPQGSGGASGSGSSALVTSGEHTTQLVAIAKSLGDNVTDYVTGTKMFSDKVNEIVEKKSHEFVTQSLTVFSGELKTNTFDPLMLKVSTTLKQTDDNAKEIIGIKQENATLSQELAEMKKHMGTMASALGGLVAAQAAGGSGGGFPQAPPIGGAGGGFGWGAGGVQPPPPQPPQPQPPQPKATSGAIQAATAAGLDPTLYAHFLMGPNGRVLPPGPLAIKIAEIQASIATTGSYP